MSSSPFVPSSFPSLPEIAGVTMASCHAGFKGKAKTDLALFLLAEGSRVAGVFTSSLCASAAVRWCQKSLTHGGIRALVVNSGNANAFTGKAGRQSVNDTAQHLKQKLNVSSHDIYLASTGVIGEPIDSQRINEALNSLMHKQRSDGWEQAARAIMTTDQFPKGSCRQFTIGDHPISIAAIAKGAGMIAPDMATMLCFIFTNATIAQPVLQQILTRQNASSFNAITVDGDTSTSDSVLLISTADSNSRAITSMRDEGAEPFAQHLHAVMHDLALQIVGDGEGARKRIAIQVQGATSDDAARIIAFSIANSPLVKTAMAGSDPNWGRIVMAIGKAGQHADPDHISISLCGIAVTHHSEPQPHDRNLLTQLMQQDELTIAVHLHLGTGNFTVWTSDLNHHYITVNAHYRS